MRLSGAMKLSALAAAARLDEEGIHRAVVGHLRARAKPCIYWTHIPSGELRPVGVGGKLVGMGLRPGLPDLLFVIAGRAHLLELKREGGRLSCAQVQAQEDLRRAGAVVETAYGLDAALDQLTRWGVFR